MILATSQIWFFNVYLHMLISKFCSFMSSTAITLDEFYFALSTFQGSGKQFMTMTLKYLLHFSRKRERIIGELFLGELFQSELFLCKLADLK